jgi:hypothetical protein
MIFAPHRASRWGSGGCAQCARHVADDLRSPSGKEIISLLSACSGVVYRKEVTFVLSAFSHTPCVFPWMSHSMEVTQMLAAETETRPAHTPPAPDRPWARRSRAWQLLGIPGATRVFPTGPVPVEARFANYSGQDARGACSPPAPCRWKHGLRTTPGRTRAASAPHRPRAGGSTV